jgi:hypothetical protein
MHADVVLTIHAVGPTVRDSRGPRVTAPPDRPHLPPPQIPGGRPPDSAAPDRRLPRGHALIAAREWLRPVGRERRIWCCGR